MTTMANKAIKDLFDIANGTITDKNIVSAVTKVRLYEAAGSLAFKQSIHQSKSGQKIHVPFFDDVIEDKEKAIVKDSNKTERKPPAEHTKGPIKKKTFVCKFKWDWLHKHVTELKVDGKFTIPFQQALVHNPGCRYQDLQNGLLNIFKRYFVEQGHTPDSFKFTTSTDKEKGTVTIKRMR